MRLFIAGRFLIFPQISQLNRSIFTLITFESFLATALCVFKCNFRWYAWKDLYSNWLHLKAFSTKWVFICVFRFIYKTSPRDYVYSCGFPTGFIERKQIWNACICEISRQYVFFYICFIYSSTNGLIEKMTFHMHMLRKFLILPPWHPPFRNLFLKTTEFFRWHPLGSKIAHCTKWHFCEKCWNQNCLKQLPCHS